MGPIKKITLILSMVVILLMPCFVGAFDKAPSELKEFGFAPDIYRDLSDCIVSVDAFGSGIGWDIIDFDEQKRPVYDSFEGFFWQKGSGVVVKGKNGGTYVLTNYHIVNPETIKITTSTVSSLETPCLKVKYEFIYVGDWHDTEDVRCDLVWWSQELDIAILKPVKNRFLKPIPYEMIGFGMWAELEEGDAITVVTGYRDPNPLKEFPFMGIFPEREWWYEARQGKVLKVGPMPFDEESIPWFSLFDVTTDAKIYPGDSGSPVFVYDNGKPYLIGLMRAISWNISEYMPVPTGERSFFTRIGEIVLRYLSTPGLD